MPIVRLPSGSLRDEVRMPLFDTITLAAAESPIGVRRFFSSVQGKSKARTNLRQNNLLETAVSYRVQGLAIDAQNFYEENADVLPVIMENSSLSLKIGEKEYWSGPMAFLCGRIEASFAAATTVAATTINNVYQRFGASAVQAVILQGKHCVDINPLQSFYAEWIIDQADLTAGEITKGTCQPNTNLKVVFSLKGLMRRPVQ
ncbi:MAG: hypothetical protein H7836_04430 [Magnetococcus sp. YQC-3]